MGQSIEVNTQRFLDSSRYQSGSQQGNSVLGMIAILVMVGFFVMCVIRMAPPYFESLTVKSIIENIVDDPEMPNYGTSQIRRRIETELNTNQIVEVEAKDIEVYRKKGQTYIDGNYEVRVPLFWRIDGVIKFNDMHYALGNLEPQGARKKK
ncbi:MAG: DUF4845 domain-containing protein [Halioglobus sp.]